MTWLFKTAASGEQHTVIGQRRGTLWQHPAGSRDRVPFTLAQQRVMCVCVCSAWPTKKNKKKNSCPVCSRSHTKLNTDTGCFTCTLLTNVSIVKPVELNCSSGGSYIDIYKKKKNGIDNCNTQSRSCCNYLIFLYTG